MVSTFNQANGDKKNTLSGRIGFTVSQFVWVLTLLAVERNSPTRQ